MKRREPQLSDANCALQKMTRHHEIFSPESAASIGFLSTCLVAVISTVKQTKWSMFSEVFFFYLFIYFLENLLQAMIPFFSKMDLTELKTIISLTHQLLVSDKRFQNEYNGSSVRPLLAVWTDLIGKTPHFLLWFWCDVSLALTLSWTLWELLGIERLIGVFELGDLIECSCHNISNTVYSPIMTQLGHGGHITKKNDEGGKKWKSTSSAVKCSFFFFFFTAETPFATATLITVNYFSSRSFSSSAFGFFWDSSQRPLSVALH